MLRALTGQDAAIGINHMDAVQLGGVSEKAAGAGELEGSLDWAGLIIPKRPRPPA